MSFTVPPSNKVNGQSGLVSDLNSAYNSISTLAEFNVLNTAYAGGADPTGAADSTAAIQAAINAASSVGSGTVYFPAGTYKTSSALVIYSGITLQGDGEGSTTVKQVTTTANGIQGVDVSYLAIRDLTLSGPGSGSGNGVSLTRSANSNIPYCEISNVQSATFGNCGFKADVLIVSHVSGCIARSNGGDGFQFTSTAGNTTSLSLDSCYANANTGTGYELDSAVYCSMSGCAADNNVGGGYALYGCQAVSLNGCGSESNTGTALLMSGGTGNSVHGLWVNVNKQYGIHVTASETFATLEGCVEFSASGATNFILTDAGTSCVVINDKHITANSFAVGTTYEALPTGTVIELTPSGDTTGVKDAALIKAAIASLPATGGVVRLGPESAWYIECGQVVINRSGVYIDAPGCYIYAVGAGDMIRMYSLDYGTDPTEGGGILGFPYVDGSKTTGTACAFHAGDILQLAVFVSVHNFTAGTASIGVWLDNNYYWTEQAYGRIRAQHCSTHVQFDNSANTSGKATGSFDRPGLVIFLDSQGAGNGVVLKNGAILVDGSSSGLGVFGNFTGGTAQYAVLTVTGSNTANGNSGISGIQLNIGVEYNVTTGTVPQTINFGAAGNFIKNCNGVIDFGADSAFTASNNNGNFWFNGPVTGDVSLIKNVATSTNLVYITSGFTTGWGGAITFQVPRGDGFVYTQIRLNVAANTALTPGMVILAAGTLPSWASPSDNTAIPVIIGGVNSSINISTTGEITYNGVAQTPTAEVFPYGQAVYMNS